MSEARSIADRRWVTRPFLVAVALLGAAAILAGPVSGRLRLHQAKLGLPLKKPFSEFDVSKIAPLRVVERQVLDSTVVEALGTDRYLSWTIEDSRVGPGDPLRFANLLVTYYSGGHNLVPHTPDVCYLGAGYQPGRAHENVMLSVPGLEATGARNPAEEPSPTRSGSQLWVRVLTFVKTAIFDRQEVSVVYAFHCNGRFVETGTLVDPRTAVRFLINDPKYAHAYFSKVEVSFPRATREESLKGAVKLFGVILPVLVRDHWPDFEAAEAEARSGVATGG